MGYRFVLGRAWPAGRIDHLTLGSPIACKAGSPQVALAMGKTRGAGATTYGRPGHNTFPVRPPRDIGRLIWRWATAWAPRSCNPCSARAAPGAGRLTWRPARGVGDNRCPPAPRSGILGCRYGAGLLLSPAAAAARSAGRKRDKPDCCHVLIRAQRRLDDGSRRRFYADLGHSYAAEIVTTHVKFLESVITHVEFRTR